MTRGNQRDNDRVKATARNAANSKGGEKVSLATKQAGAISDADKMREKQRLADLKKQGIVEEAPEVKKEYDTSFMQQYNVADED